MNLSEKIAKYETVQGPNCKGCGNPWFFAIDNELQCTTCGKQVEKEKHE